MCFFFYVKLSTNVKKHQPGWISDNIATAQRCSVTFLLCTCLWANQFVWINLQTMHKPSGVCHYLPWLCCVRVATKKTLSQCWFLILNGALNSTCMTLIWKQIRKWFILISVSFFINRFLQLWREIFHLYFFIVSLVLIQWWMPAVTQRASKVEKKVPPLFLLLAELKWDDQIFREPTVYVHWDVRQQLMLPFTHYVWTQLSAPECQTLHHDQEKRREWEVAAIFASCSEFRCCGRRF